MIFQKTPNEDALKTLYEAVYGEPFTFDDPNCHPLLQYAVFLLGNMGVQIGEYSFSFDEHGPYSFELDMEIHSFSTGAPGHIRFTEFADNKIMQLRGYILEYEKYPYSMREWAECIASIHYLKNVCRIKGKNLIFALMRSNENLFSLNANTEALEIVRQIDAI